jgi:transcriptional regulator with XRE-family HTH domain
MNTLDLRTVRQSLGWTQKQTAEHLAVSQALVSMVENRQRSLTAAMQYRLGSYYELSPAHLPLREPVTMTDSEYAKELTNLGYPGFAHRKDKDRDGKPSWNPAQLAVMALSANTLDRRVAEGLPFLVLRYWDADWNWAVQQLKVQDLQNRLGFVVTLARELAEKQLAEKNGLGSPENLHHLESQLERSRLVRQDTFCNEGMTQAERKWLQTQASPQAQHWNLLSDLRPEHLTHVA